MARHGAGGEVTTLRAATGGAAGKGVGAAPTTPQGSRRSRRARKPRRRSPTKAAVVRSLGLRSRPRLRERSKPRTRAAPGISRSSRSRRWPTTRASGSTC
eukprot:1189621-Alexandrium_andersonii.AAC.1